MILLWLTVFLFVFGLCIGSFLNVLIYRLPQNLSLLGRSFCSKCKKKIAWYDNFPLLSFLLLSGRCRWCRSPISWQYPLVELATGILTVLIVNYLTLSGQNLLSVIYYLLSVYALIVIFVIDLREEIIPDQIIFPLILISLILNFANLPFGLLAGGFFLFLYLITRGKGMGFGDVKLVLFMGLFLGWPKIVIALYLAFLTGAILGVILIIMGKKKLTSHLPFGPFLAGATIISFFYGEIIWQKLSAVLL